MYYVNIVFLIPSSFIGKWGAYFGGMDTVNWFAVGITIVTVLIAVYMPKITNRVPGSFVAILVVTPIVTFLLPEGAVTTIGSEFGEIKCNLTPDGRIHCRTCRKFQDRQASGR